MIIVHTHVFDHPDRYVLSIYRDMIFVYVYTYVILYHTYLLPTTKLCFDASQGPVPTQSWQSLMCLSSALCKPYALYMNVSGYSNHPYLKHVTLW